MTQFQFKKAERKGIWGRIAIDGPTGSGKTFTALAIAQGMRNGKRVALIDTERRSADRYADVFDFDKVDLVTYSPDTYCEAIRAISPEEYSVTIIDSWSHAWTGKEGALEQVDRAAARSQSGNKFTAWRDVTPMHNRMIDTMLGIQTHLIVTMRSKMEYILEEDERGRKVPRKVGMAPIQRDGVEYEFDIVGDMNLKNEFVVTKSRAVFLNQQVIVKPTEELGKRILEWCGHVDAVPTDEELKELAVLAAEHEVSTDQVKALSTKMFQKGVRELTMEEFHQLKNQVVGKI